MTKELTIKSLCDSFEQIKSFWETKSSVLTLCIAEMMKYDAEISLDMWYYLLNNNKKDIKTREGSELIIKDVLIKIEEVLATIDDRDEEFLIGEYVVPYLAKRVDILELIYKKSFCAGSHQYEYMGETTVCFVFMILKGYSDAVRNVMYFLSKNTHMKEVSIGNFLTNSLEIIERIFNNNEVDYEIGDDIKNELLDSLAYIKNKTERAECSIAIMSLPNHSITE